VAIAWLVYDISNEPGALALVGLAWTLPQVAGHLAVLVVFYGLGQALFQPAFTAIVPDVVPREELLQANALRELMEPLGLRFAGPAFGGVLIALFGVGVAFLLDALILRRVRGRSGRCTHHAGAGRGARRNDDGLPAHPQRARPGAPVAGGLS